MRYASVILLYCIGDNKKIVDQYLELSKLHNANMVITPLCLLFTEGVTPITK